MSNYPMVDEVNRLVGDLLAGSGEVFLPGVGTLYVERRGAKRLSRRSVLPPSRAVSFTSQQRGVALPAALAGKVHCSEEEAKEIYDRWLARVREGDTLTVEGVGVLKFKSFTLSPAFDRLLNPQGHEPVRIKPARSFDWALWVGIAAIAVAAVFGGNEFLKLYTGDDRPAAVTAETPVAETAAGTPAPADSLAAAQPAGTAVDSAADSGAAGTTAASAEQSAKTAGTDASGPATVPVRQPETAAVGQPSAPAGSADVPASLVSGRHYVVLGVFSTPENAARAAAEAVKKDASVRCGIYRYGSKYMVSPFEAADAEACALFIRNYSDRFPGMWPYTAR